MIVFDTLFILLIIYLFIYCAYQLFFFIKARDIEQYFEMHEKTRSIVLEKRKLCVIIYATIKDKNLDKLLGILNNQSYSKENYEVHVVYQKEENDASVSRDFALGARIHNIQNPDYFSKDKAVNLFLQKMIEEQKFDAYVFLGANRMVGEKYLENINKSLNGSCVLVGSKVCVNEINQFAKRVKNSIISAYLKYVSRTNSIVRSLFNLPFFIDGENLVITSDVLEKMGYVGIEDKDSELEYSLDLASNDIKSIYSPYIITAIDVKNYDFSSPSWKNKFTLFVHYFPLLAFKANSFKEFILFLLKPNSLIVLFSYLLLLILSIYMPNHVAQKAVVLLGVFLFINFVISIYTSKIAVSEIFWLLFYPICLSWQKLKILINSLTMRSIMDSEYEEEHVNSATINAVVNNSKKDFVCKLDLVSEDGMRKVVFREGNRFIVTDSYLRMYDALADMTYKLKSKGMILKICQNCQHFSISPDGTLDCLNGKCQISQSEILVWNGCQFFYANPEVKEEN
ncbi:MAG: hypothetical protein IKL52_00930 [Candidatus Gastranaerophilales bacterium]|nr:hypothetical protein [Candidatus Gastranaerophilales bacterium]